MKKEYKEYLHKNISNDFGISVDKLAPQVTNIGRFQAWLGGNVSKIKKVLNIVKSEGVSPAFFAAYESSEGVSQFGWLNHTGVQGDAYTDARLVARWVVSQSKTPAIPAWTDTGTNNWDVVPASVKQEGNADAKSYKTGDIGRVVISGTAAATWSVYYPPALQGSVNGIKDYGNPMAIQVANIKKWGGDLGHSSGRHSGGKDTPSSDDSISGILKDLGREGQKVLEALFNEIEKMLTYDLHSIGTDMFFSNEYFKLFKTYNNTYRIQINIPFFDTLEKKVGSLDFGSNGSKGSKDKDDKDDKDDSKPSSNQTMEKIYQYLKKNVGNKFDADGAYGAQCVDLVHHVSNHFGLGLNTAGDYAKNIASNPVPSGWKHVNVPNGASKAQRTKIWNDLPRGAVVYFWNAGAGHVGFKSGDNFKLLSQNMKNDALMGGGNITNENVSNFESGNHFFKAWVKE